MMPNSNPWRFMRLRAEQLYEEGEMKKALRLMSLINHEQQMQFEKQLQDVKIHHKIVSTR